MPDQGPTQTSVAVADDRRLVEPGGYQQDGCWCPRGHPGFRTFPYQEYSEVLFAGFRTARDA